MNFVFWFWAVLNLSCFYCSIRSIDRPTNRPNADNWNSNQYWTHWIFNCCITCNFTTSYEQWAMIELIKTAFMNIVSFFSSHASSNSIIKIIFVCNYEGTNFSLIPPSNHIVIEIHTIIFFSLILPFQIESRASRNRFKALADINDN